MVIEAARAALAGKNLDEIVALVKRMIPNNTYDPDRRYTSSIYIWVGGLGWRNPWPGRC